MKIDNLYQLQNYFKTFNEVSTTLGEKKEIKITILKPNNFQIFCNYLRYLFGLQEIVKIIIANKEHKIYLPSEDRAKNLWEKVQNMVGPFV